jgi:quinol-cytochrome oxidoreductase complex cytochrome b subunit
MQKIVGFTLVIIGLSLIIFFPFLDRHQPEEMAKAAAIIGIVLTGIGIFLLKS